MKFYYLTTDKTQDFIILATDPNAAEKKADRHCERNREKFLGLVEMGDAEKLRMAVVNAIVAQFGSAYRKVAK